MFWSSSLRLFGRSRVCLFHGDIRTRCLLPRSNESRIDILIEFARDVVGRVKDARLRKAATVNKNSNAEANPSHEITRPAVMCNPSVMPQSL